MINVDLRGKRALITGASRGIGHHLAKVLATAGAEVVLLARTAGPLESAAAEIRQLGLSVSSVAVDLADPAMDRVRVNSIVEEHGPFDILVNNAGTAARVPMLDIDLADWRSVMATNVDAVLLLSQACARGMIDRGWGRIISVGSPYGQVPSPGIGAYCVSKAALDMLTKAMALEWARTGVTVNAIAPVQVRTALTEATFQDEERRALVMSQIPVGRWAEPSDLAGALLLLADEGSAMITGQTLYVDGGRLLV